MTHFIYDNTTLDFPKIDEAVLAPDADATQYILAENWNKTCQALLDVKGAFRAAKWVGVEAQSVDPTPSGVSDYIWVSNTGILNVKRSGTNNQVVYATRQITAGEGLTGGGNLGSDLSFALDPLSPNPAGSYSRASIVVDAYGRITAASSNSTTSAYSLMQNDATVLEDRSTLHVDGSIFILEDDPTNVWTHLRLADTAVAPGAYTYASITVDAQGRLTAAASGVAPALASLTLTAGTGLSGGGDLSANRTFNLADTAVAPGSYTYASLTVDQQGRLTAASNGSAPAMASVTLTAGNGLTGGGDLSANRSFAIDTAVAVDLTTAQVLTNKTLTSPTIQGTVGAGTGLTMPPFDMDGAGTGAGEDPGFATFLSGGIRITNSVSTELAGVTFTGEDDDLAGGGMTVGFANSSYLNTTIRSSAFINLWNNVPFAIASEEDQTFMLFIDPATSAMGVMTGTPDVAYSLTVAGAGVKILGTLAVVGGWAHTGSTVGFFSATPVAQAIGGENVTNNVTSGGTTGVVADLTTTVGAASAGADTVDISTVPLKADLEARLATIANDLYQITRLLKQDHDQLRALGFLT